MKIMTTGLGIGIGLLAATLVSGCFFASDEGDGGNNNPPGSGPCVDVPSAVRTRADSLVDLANFMMTDNFAFWFDTAQDQSQRRTHDALGAIAVYDQALALAPGHCQAIFGKAIARATLVIQDTQMDAFIRKLESLDSENVSIILPPSTAALLKTSPDRAAPILLKVSSAMDHVDPPTVTEIQNLIESSIMPRLDTVIQAMETVMNYASFAIRYRSRARVDWQGYPIPADTVELDRSEVGPGLAALKVGKAYLTVIAGYNWEVAINGKYDWTDTLEAIQDFSNLTTGQSSAVEHVKGLFSQTSTFSHYRATWTARIQGIPALLLGAVGDAQRGLVASIDESKIPGSQTYDLWVAGDGQTADVDTADLRLAIETLERSKKYLSGVVPVSYKKGTRTLRVNFTRFFMIDGIQGVLPYFRFLPTAECDDTVSTDTTWQWGGYMTGSSQDEIFRLLGLGTRNSGGLNGGYWNLYTNSTQPGDFEVEYSSNDPVGGYVSLVIATLTHDVADPCSFDYVKEQDMVGPATDTGIQWTPNQTSGTIRVSLCRSDSIGMAEFADLRVQIKGPIEFTDAAGARTFGAADFNTLDSLPQLTGRIVFRDPTFGGVFPDMTNLNIWNTIQSLDGVSDRVTCVEDPITYQCRWILPSSPSDLDYLVYTLKWPNSVL